MDDSEAWGFLFYFCSESSIEMKKRLRNLESVQSDAACSPDDDLRDAASISSGVDCTRVFLKKKPKPIGENELVLVDNHGV